MTEKAVNEELMLQIVRNALLVAGHEMGEGDHTPLVNATIHNLTRDYEDYKNKRAAFDELRKYYAHVISELQRIRPECDEKMGAAIDETLPEIIEVYEASFAPVDAGNVYVDPNLVNLNAKRADRILRTLEDRS